MCDGTTGLIDFLLVRQSSQQLSGRHPSCPRALVAPANGASSVPERPYFNLTARVELKRGVWVRLVSAPVTEVKKGQWIKGITRLTKTKSQSSGDRIHEKERDSKVRRQPIFYEPDESLMSWFAWFMAFLDSDLESACGSNVWMALPRLIFLVLAHGDVAPTAVFMVISHINPAKPPGISRLLAT